MPRSSVEEVRTDEIRRGDRIWAPGDGDWLLVDRIDRDPVGDAVFYRIDHSEATFDAGARVLRQVQS